MNFYSFARVVLRPVSCIFFPIKVHGDRTCMPDDTGVVLCANHISFLDVIFLAFTFKRQIHFVAKEKYANAFMLKTLFKWLESFGINTEKPDIAAIKRCINVAEQGDVLGIFPEGTRILNGKVSNPMPGVMMIAQKAKAPIVYARIRPKHGKFRLFSRTDIYVGGCTTTQKLGVTNGRGSEYKAASEKLMKMIYKLGENDCKGN